MQKSQIKTRENQAHKNKKIITRRGYVYLWRKWATQNRGKNKAINQIHLLKQVIYQMRATKG